MKADPVAADAQRPLVNEPRTAAGRALLGASREMLRIGGTLSPATVNEMIQRIEAEAASLSAGDQVVDPTIGDMQRALAKAMGCPLDDTYPDCSHGGDAWEYARHLIRDGLVITPLQADRAAQPASRSGDQPGQTRQDRASHEAGAHELDVPGGSIDVERLALPWHRETVGHLSTAGIAARIAADLDVPLAEGIGPNTDATWIVNADNKIVAFVGNGPRQTHNADTIIEAVARLSRKPLPNAEIRLLPEVSDVLHRFREREVTEGKVIEVIRDAVAEGHQDARELDWDTRAQEQKDYIPGPSELVDYGD